MPAQYGTSTASLQSVLATQSHLPVNQIFQRLEIIGKGAYGSVHRGRHLATGAIVALKIVDLDIADDDVEDIRKEVALLSSLRGGERNNIISYYGCWLDGPRVWIAMDCAQGGSIRTLMKSNKGGIIEERYAVQITREMLIALAFLHKNNIIHRDIKAANVLLTAQGNILLCDFGVSALMASAHSKRSTFVGTPYWMSPEVARQGSYDTKADIWSLGITVYEMVMGAPPHATVEAMRVLTLIPNTKPPRLPDTTGTIEMRNFVAAVLRELPADRPTAEELLHAKWIKNAKRDLPLLRKLIVRYEDWKQQGGVRESLVGDLPWELEGSDESDLHNPWEFDTVRGISTSEGWDLAESSHNGSTNARSTAHAPPSLTRIWQDSSTPIEAPPRPIVRRVPPPDPIDIDSPTHHKQPTLNSSQDVPDSLLIEEGADYSNIPTAKPSDSSGNQELKVSGNGSPPPIPSLPGHSDIPASLRPGHRGPKGLPHIAVPARKPSQTSFSDSQLDGSPRLFPSARRPVEEGSWNRGTRRRSPEDFTFPPPQGAPPRAPLAPTTSPTSTQSPHSVLFPMNSSHSAQPEVVDRYRTQTFAPPPLQRAMSATPYVGETTRLPNATVRPPISRGYSTGVSDVSLMPSRTRPARSPSVSGSQVDASSTLAPPKPSGLKEVLQLPIANLIENSIDRLPPSPSAHSAQAQFKPVLAAIRGLHETPPSPSPSRFLDNRKGDTSEPSSRAASHSRSQSYSSYQGPPTVRPLDYSLLDSSEAVHAELSQIVGDLAQWLNVIESGLNSVLEPNFKHVDNDTEDHLMSTLS